MDFEKLCKEAHAQAVKSGWWPEGEKKSELEIMALIHSEISEAVEECRKGTPPIYQHGAGYEKFPIITPDHKEWNDKHKPEGQLIELADACIRIFDYIGYIDSIRPGFLFTIKNEYDYSLPTFYKKPIDFYGACHSWLCRRTLAEVVGKIEKWCFDRGWNLEEAIEKKMTYNATRPYRHGNKLY